MRRLSTFSLLTLVLFALFSLNAFSENPARGTNTSAPSFIDENGDGICDNYANGGRGLGLRNGTGPNFVDADGDGVCDNLKNGRRQSAGGQKLNRRNFVDADGDGVCDNRGSGKGKANRGGKGGGNGRAGGTAKVK